MKDWDGMDDVKELAKYVKITYPDATRWQFAFHLRFIQDVESGEGEDRWVSIPFGSNLKTQVRNANDYLDVLLSGKMNYGVVIPLGVIVVIQ